MTAYTPDKCPDCVSGNLAQVRSTVTRRRFLVRSTVLGVAAVTGCHVGTSGTVSRSDVPTPATGAPENPDDSVLRAAVADMTALLASIRATIHIHPGLTKQLRPLTRVVNEQLTVLGSANPREQPTQTTTRPSAPPVPDGAGRALSAVRRQTHQATTARLDDTLAAESGPFARVLAAISAGLDTQVVRLGGPARLASIPPRGSVDRQGAARLQLALAAEHAAVYAYGVIGARGGGDQRMVTARIGHDVHLDRRNMLASMIQGAGRTPTAALPSYDLPDRITRAVDVARFARTVELRCCEVFALVVSETTADGRGFCAQALTSCANWSVVWGQAPQPFPGAPEL
jgi:Domain of unknown function (DUF4439)